MLEVYQVKQENDGFDDSELDFDLMLMQYYAYLQVKNRFKVRPSKLNTNLNVMNVLVISWAVWSKHSVQMVFQ